jgi:hypothetical protein
VLGLPPNVWRRPRKAQLSEIKYDVFKKYWDEFDWTKLLD